MATLVIRNVPDDLHACLKQHAQQHHRSVTKEVISLIEDAVTHSARGAQLPPPLELKSGCMLTIKEIEAAIAEGQE